MEEFRTEFATLPADLRLNVWPDWPDEHFVRYWDPRWWELVVRPRLEQAMRAGFDGVYLDTPLAYEEIDLARVPGESRRSLGRKMADLIVRISAHAKASRPGFLVVPQNSPELRHHAGYTEAIDGHRHGGAVSSEPRTGPCDRQWCGENLSEAAALRAAGKAVLATDYATTAAHRRTACEAYGRAGFAGNVTTVELDVVSPLPVTERSDDAEDCRRCRHGIRGASPLTAAMAAKGYRVHGVDANPEVVQALARGRVHVYEPGVAEVFADHLGTGVTVGHTLPDGVPLDAVILCVSTPVDLASGAPRLGNLAEAAAACAGQRLVVVRSTVPIGTSRAPWCCRGWTRAPGWSWRPNARSRARRCASWSSCRR
ncbi:endo alpha-1,4 polygalactosaminidase [Nonomuraea dietziae]|uniref:endo alpha-1,4 polygalactosaminidase n=1 Tax=Nonomuraea dietziae TaxID=65515 RepID=UPI0031DB0AE3